MSGSDSGAGAGTVPLISAESSAASNSRQSLVPGQQQQQQQLTNLQQQQAADMAGPFNTTQACSSRHGLCPGQQQQQPTHMPGSLDVHVLASIAAQGKGSSSIGSSVPRAGVAPEAAAGLGRASAQIRSLSLNGSSQHSSQDPAQTRFSGSRSNSYHSPAAQSSLKGSNGHSQNFELGAAQSIVSSSNSGHSNQGPGQELQCHSASGAGLGTTAHSASQSMDSGGSGHSRPDPEPEQEQQPHAWSRGKRVNGSSARRAGANDADCSQGQIPAQSEGYNLSGSSGDGSTGHPGIWDWEHRPNLEATPLSPSHFSPQQVCMGCM